MTKQVLLTCLLFVCLPVIGQNLTGRVIDAQTKAPIPFAQIFIVQTESGLATDSAGYFSTSLSLPKQVRLKVRASMYETLIVDTVWTDHLILAMQSIHLEFDDVIVSVPGGRKAHENVYHVDRVALKDLNAIQSSTLPEAIGKINGVQTASTGPGIAKPVIRGVQGSRVLTMVNGVRIENQQWGSDHGMAVNELGIGHVEVIKGPSSLLYGNDALGGVLFLVDAPYANPNQYEVQLNSRVETVNRSTTNSFIAKKSFNKFRFMAGALHTTATDFELPTGQFAKDSRYNQLGAKFNVGYLGKNWTSQFRFTLSNGRFGVVGHTHDENPNPASFLANTTSRQPDVPAQVIGNQIAAWQNKFFYGKNELDITLSHSINDLVEYEEKFTIEALSVKLHSSYVNAKNIWRLKRNYEIVTGVQAQYQQNINLPNVALRLIPDYNQSDAGFYGLINKKVENWTFEVGGRLDFRSLEVIDTAFSKRFQTSNFSTGLVRKKKWSTTHLNLSTGTRLPHVSELLSDGAHHGSLRYERGNANLEREKSYQIDLNQEIDLEHIRIQVNPHFAYVEDFIVLTPQDSTVNGLPYFEYNQFSDVQLYGVDISIHYHPHFAHWLHVESAYNYVRIHTLNGQSLPLVPQPKLYNLLAAKINYGSKLVLESINVQHEHYFAQRHVAREESTSSAYHLLDASVKFSIGKKRNLQANLGVKNILNQAYINHLSSLKNIGISSPGRSYYLSINYLFNNKQSK